MYIKIQSHNFNISVMQNTTTRKFYFSIEKYEL